MHDLEKMAAVWGEAVSADLTGLLGKEVTVSCTAIAEGPRESVLDQRGSVVVSACSVEGDDHEDIYVASGVGAALAMAAAQLGKGAAELKGAELEGEVAEAHRGVMDVCVGILSRVFDEEASLPGLTLGDVAVVEMPPGDEAKPDAGEHRRARFEIVIDGGSAETIDWLVPAQQAATWFGPSPGAPVAEQNAWRIGLIDTGVKDRAETDALAEQLGSEVVTLELADLAPDHLDEIAECGALIVAWSLTGLSGLDVLDTIQRDSRLEGLRVALASEEPTEAMVSAALRWGAHTFLGKPYDPDEIRARLLASES